MDASTFAVGRVTLRTGAVGAAVALRLRAASELQAADLTPAGLPPASVLVVRRLADPMPRRFRAQYQRPSQEWECAVRGALAAQARSAARPDAQGRLDPSATAVLFDDEAQAIACLIVDLVNGRVASTWWWASLLPRLNLPQTAALSARRDPAAILAARARDAPAVLTTVVRWGEAAAIARALTREGASAAQQSLSREHGVPLAVIAEQPEAMAGVSAARSGRTERAAARERPTVPWARWVPPAIAGTGVIPEVQRLFGVALCVHESPTHLHASTAASGRQPPPVVVDRASVDRAVTNASTIAAVRDTPEHRQSPEAARELTTPGQAARADATLPSAVTPATVGAKAIPSEAPTAPASEDGMTPRHDASPPPAPEGNVPPLTAAAVGETPDVAAAPESVPGSRVAGPHARVLKRRSSAVGKGNTAGEPVTAVARRTGVLATEGVPTRLGGVFYLLHALQALNVPAAFERGWHVETTAGSWGTLDLIARALVGPRFDQTDPIWQALGHLAGWPAGPQRDGAAAAVLSPWAARSDPAFAAPCAWCTELDDPLERLAWSVAGTRLWLWSRKGYLLDAARTAADADLDTAVRRRARRRHAPGARRPAALASAPPDAIPWMPPAMLPRGCPVRLGRWAAAVAPAVLRRLLVALDGSADSPCARPARGRSVLRALEIPGRLYVTSSHVDVVMAMQSIDLRARRAGLDRNPGWLPSFGRVVYFHFE